MDDSMRRFLRWFAAVMTFAIGYFFSFWVIFGLVARSHAPAWVSVPGSVLLAGLAAWAVFRRIGAAADDGGSFAALVASVAYGALVTGLIGFAGGFFGPMIFAPGANQGPLLGILITGPLGVVLGALGGGVYWLVRGRRGGSATDAR